MKKRRIYLIRHGETEFNRLGIFRGRYEVDLNEVGRQQASQIGKALEGAGIEFLVTSPLTRAVETAEIIASALGIDYFKDEAFNNIALGEWQGVPKQKIKDEYPDLWHLWTTEPEKLAIPGGETVEDVRRRSFAGLKRILEDRMGTFAVVTHRSVIKALAAAMLDVNPPYFWKFYIDNAAFSVFEVTAAGYTLISWNNNAHLTEKVTEVF